MLDTNVVEARLRECCFRLEWEDGGATYHGTGFFISSRGVALTAFHNIPREVRDDPRRVVRGWYRGALVPFRWALTSEVDIQWQKELEIAVLQLETRVKEVKTSSLRYVQLRWDEARRKDYWKGRAVGVFGFPFDGGADGELVLGTVRTDVPLQRVETPEVKADAAVALADGFQGENLGGLSGGPLYCRKTNTIQAVAFAADRERKRIYATELHHVAKKWPQFQRWASPCPPTYSMPLWVKALATFTLTAGILIWHPWPPSPEPFDQGTYLQTHRDTLYAPEPGLQWVGSPKGAIRVGVFRYPGRPLLQPESAILIHEERWMPVLPGAPFRNGDHVRFSVESPADGYLYVFDRERYRDGTLSGPFLIFPAESMARGNSVRKAERIEFPAASDTPPYMRLKASRQDHVGEILTFVVTSQPLNIEPGASPREVDKGRFQSLTGEGELPSGFQAKVFFHPEGSAARASLTLPVRIVP